NKKNFRDVVRLISSNILKLASSVATMFIIPIVFNQTNYGYYKLFLLYVSYAGIFNFGLIDGIYLYYAGKSIEELPVNEFKYYSRFLIKTVLFSIIPFILYSFLLS